VFRHQLNCDISIKAAWVLFDPEESLESIAKFDILLHKHFGFLLEIMRSDYIKVISQQA